jgi:hypothetical protein
MKVGVLFPSRFEDPGEFLADARAMEAAGVDSVWMEDGDGLDPTLVLAAIAAVTGRLRLGLITRAEGRSGRALETLQHLSRQRVITLSPSALAGEVPPLAGEGRVGASQEPDAGAASRPPRIERRGRKRWSKPSPTSMG